MNDVSFHGIVAGDIVGSSRLSPRARRQLGQTMVEAHDEVAEAFGELVPHPLAISAGDEWRMYIERPEDALAATIALWTHLRARELESRIVLAAGAVDFIEDGDLHRADGPAFRKAGRSLDAITERTETFGLYICHDELDPVESLWVETTSELLDVLLTDLTPSQARAVAEMICGIYRSGAAPTRKEIAGRWKPRPVTAQTVNEHLQRARWPAIDRTLDRFESFWNSEP